MARARSLFVTIPLLVSGLVVQSHAQSIPRRAGSLLARADAWDAGTVAALGHVRTDATPLESAGNILALYYGTGDAPTLRVSYVAPVGIRDGQDHFVSGRIQTIVLLDEGPGGETTLPAPLSGPAPFAWDRMLVFDPAGPQAALAATAARGGRTALAPQRFALHLDQGWVAAMVPDGSPVATQAAVYTVADGRVLDQLITPLGAQGGTTYSANVAFAHHGNQGLSYSDVFFGRSGAESSSGYDEILRVHQQTNVPGNFHLGALLQTAAEWDARNGAPVDFNAWLRAGTSGGWAAMLTSAYGQPIMPFLQGAMNDWAINRDAAMVNFRYNYTPRVAWVPERVFLDPSRYPSAGVIDWSGAHWQANGVNGIILDDWPHGAGVDKNQIHFLNGNNLRIILRDGDFTGKLHAGDGAGALATLQSLAASGLGQYRLVTYADDWEMAAAVAGWENTMPFALGTYQWMINKCSTESAWLHTWKLDAALGNPDFDGTTLTPGTGTYSTIGGTDGYGGGNNGWYADWAGYVPYANGGNGSGGCAGSGGNCKNHGTLWNDAHLALENAPNNTIREAGWYVLMTNLHETGWHDYLGGPLSGWERQYSAKIKNANIYAEASHWAAGQYANATGAYLSDIDDDGINELVMYNDRVFAVFESIGGRCTHLFARGPGYGFSVVGVDNAYWYGTEGDYNDGNHVAALSDVGPNHQNDLYAMNVDVASGSTVQATFTCSGVKKTVRLAAGQPYLDCIYRVGANTQYLQAGFSPDLVDLIYNARMDRIWGGGNRTYMGQRNPDTGATAAFVLGGGGATFNLDYTGTLSKVDEIDGTQKFEFLLYAGSTGTPYGSGQIVTLDSLSNALGDVLPPEAASGTYFPTTHQLALTFDEAVRYDQVVPTAIAIDANDDGVADVTLDGATVVLTASNAATLTLQVSPAVHTALQALNHGAMRLLLQPGAVRDVAGNPCAQLTDAGNVMVSYGPPTSITLDGAFNPSEWPSCTVAVPDSNDSQWNASSTNITNEIEAVDCQWDSTYLYLGIRGVATANSWLLYLDTDPGGANGQTDLTAIDHWPRGAKFTAAGFKPDWEFGAYQHQGPYDSQSFFRLLSATSSADSTSAILAAFDPNHTFGLNGGSEIAIPWNTLYGLGAGHVPAHCAIGFVTSLAYDVGNGGQLGGDQAPNQISAVVPTLDNRALVVIDANGDGVPDLPDRTPPALTAASATGWDTVITLQFSKALSPATANQAFRYAVYETGNPANTVPVRTATLQPDGMHVVLLVTGMIDVPYTVLASGIADATCYANVAASTSVAFQGPPVSVDPEPGRTRVLALAMPRPNPARGGATVLTFTLPGDAPAHAALGVFDLHGRRVRTLVDAVEPAGEFRIPFDGRNDGGARLAPGVYFVRLSRGSESQYRRFVVLP